MASLPDKLNSVVRNRLRHALSVVAARRTIKIPSSCKMVSFTFDDAPQSAYRIGGALLKKYNCFGTYYISYGKLGVMTDFGAIMTGDDVRSMVADGHEAGCHTADHSNAWDVTNAEFERSIVTNKEVFSQLHTGCNLESFSYPFGSATIQSKKNIQKNFHSARGIVNGINTAECDLNLLKAVSLYSRGIMMNQKLVGNAIRYVVENGGWLIFYTHDIQESPSPYGCTPQQLEETILKVIDSEIEVLPVRSALAKIQLL